MTSLCVHSSVLLVGSHTVCLPHRSLLYNQIAELEANAFGGMSKLGELCVGASRHPLVASLDWVHGAGRLLYNQRVTRLVAYTFVGLPSLTSLYGLARGSVPDSRAEAGTLRL